MRKSWIPVLITSIILAACSPAEYQVNPPAVEEVKAIPESKKEGYMRIIGDLRWDQLTSKEEWMERFPECLTDRNSTTKKVEDDTLLFNIGDRKCENFVAGGVPLNPGLVKFGDNAGTKSKTMTTDVYFSFFNVSHHRAVKATLTQKYPGASDGHCSKYTCWVLENDRWWSDSHIIARPTPYSISLLDQVKLDTSDF